MTTTDITKIALECLRIRLETSKLEKEVEKANAETASILLEKVDVWVKKVLDAISKITSPIVPAPPPFRIKPRKMEINYEDLVFFAKKTTVSNLETLIADLTSIFEDRKKKEGSL